ncbi:MAG: tRNA (guanosine(46)-N7)-methyltransferase TrmB [candidate division KSB1 bacterium]
MARNKLQRYAELPHLPNVFHNPKQMKGAWRSDHLKNDNPITLELACGRGAYTLGLAQKFPERNLLGVDAKGDRIWKGAKAALALQLDNVAFLRGHIEWLADYFATGEVDEIWITFPEPHPKRCKAKCRLTSPRFLNVYGQILRGNGRIHFKTDDQDLLEYTLETLEAERCAVQRVITDVHHMESADELLQIQTTYEARFLAEGRTIKYVCFGINP